MKISLGRHHALLGKDGAFRNKIDYVTIYYINGFKVTAILLNGWILPVGGVALGRVSAQPAKQACFSSA